MQLHQALRSILLLLPFITHAQPIIFLQGPCSPTKKEIFNASKVQHPHWAHICEQEIYTQALLNRYQQQFPQQYATICHFIQPDNRYHALQHNQIIFNETATEQNKKETRDALEYIRTYYAQRPAAVLAHTTWQTALRFSTITTILDASSSKKVIVNCCSFTPDETQLIANNAPLKKASVYCPLPVVIEQTRRANQEAWRVHNLSNVVPIRQILTSYLTHYSLQPGSTSIPSHYPLYILSKQNFELAMGDAFKQITGSGQNTDCFHKIGNDLSVDDFIAFKTNLESMAFNNEQSAHVVPMYPAEITLRTDRKSVNECVDDIFNVMRSFP